MAIVLFTRHSGHYHLGRKFTIVTDRRALQWLHNFEDPDGLTARWLEKLAAFEYEVRHEPRKSIGYADELSRITQAKVKIVPHDSKVADLSDAKPSVYEWLKTKPALDPSTLPTEVLTTPPQYLQPAIPSSAANPNIEGENFKYHEDVGDIFNFDESLAHCIAWDFKMRAGIPGTIRCR